MFSISDISLGSSAKKRYTRSLSHDNNTTMPFGFVQPLLSQRLEASSDIVVSTRQLVRLAPLPVPTFGRMKSDNITCVWYIKILYLYNIISTIN